MRTFQEQFLKIRRCSVPLVAIETSDPEATIKKVKASLEGTGLKSPQCNWEESPAFTWDICAGVRPRNKIANAHPIESAQMPDKFLTNAKITSPSSIVFLMNAHKFLNIIAFVQAVWNLRDDYKANGNTLVLLGPAFVIPPELINDVLLISDNLPTIEEVAGIVQETINLASATTNKKEMEKLPQVLLGISAFAVDQSVALAIDFKSNTVDREELWERKRRMVEATPGLSVWRGTKETFENLGGLSNIKEYLGNILTSKTNPINCIGFIDEIEKLFAGSSCDLSGVSQDQLRVILTEMQDNDIPGIILIGPPGTGKTALGKAAASLNDCEFINFDTGAMTGSLVGESQAKIRAAFKTFKAVSQGHGMFIATCNKIAALPPELRRRFSLGTFYVDLPSDEERLTIWKIWLKKYGISTKTWTRSLLPDDSGWTGAEIKACCDVSIRSGKSLQEAAKFIVPVCKSAADQIETLRLQASGRFISASESGVYVYEPEKTKNNQHRKFA
jgi:hypothetical protein